jgi:hypothetical protein
MWKIYFVYASFAILFSPVALSADLPPDAQQQIEGAQSIIDSGQKARGGSIGQPPRPEPDPTTARTGQERSPPPASSYTGNLKK